MSDELVDPRCPDCGEPVGTTATYCMHCSADLSDRGPIDAAAERSATGPTSTDGRDGDDGPLLDPDGAVDDSLTVVVGVVGGLVVGLVATFALLFFDAGLALLGVVVWVGATVYLVRRRTVQAAVSKAAYGVALVLLLVPLIPLSPAVETSTGGDRVVGAVVLTVLVGVPALVAAGVGYLASRYVPDSSVA
ncbi:zinc ribbon domain-containing protein [Salinirubellus salinus]|uniref:Zinc ribbon domain-containing protein n=1 Tax=Salinirubellus salinus TaxID=1364945 RepID=A0A9E7R0F5_9EURY|nr:zinc ribbon domain-containing protein [Salinirubellus salinus]UWM53257.1 zinc ribbon domain-containing protein [Salinirubellus salinus]